MDRTILFLLLFVCFCSVSGFTDPEDAAAIRSLKASLQSLPPNWYKSDDPCGDNWEGIKCDNSKITTLKLSSMGLKGSLSGDIGELSELRTVDLSYNRGITGPLTPNFGNLKNLSTLILLSCSFTGKLPDELGNLRELTYLALNSNNFTGEIPPSLGNLSKLYWLDLADNQLTGSIPVSPGLDQLLGAKHFHLNKNQLSGVIPPKLFGNEMKLIHVLLDGNMLTGRIPSTIGLIETLEILRLDRNSLEGSVPGSISNLTRLSELHLANNQLTGPIPDLSKMDFLNYVDLSNNSFDSSLVPEWFSTISSLTTLVMESLHLQGPLPSVLFRFPQIEQVKLKDNQLNGTLDIRDGLGDQLDLIDLKSNSIGSITVGPVSSKYKDIIELYGNPVCLQSNERYCRQIQPLANTIYSTSFASCRGKQCPPNQKLNPQSCNCAYAFGGTLYFRAPLFRDLTNSTRFQSLETFLWTKLELPPGSVSLQNLFFNLDDYLQVQLDLFPPNGEYFSRSEINIIGYELSNQFQPPKEFGPYYFIASPYIFQTEKGKSTINIAVIIGIAVGCTVLVLVLVGVAAFACCKKRRAEKAKEISNPFASWGLSTGMDGSGPPPQLKGARWFTYEELRKSTNNFSDSHQIGSGGYGKVYKGILPDGQLIAVKRAQLGAVRRGAEFKTEIELLSRVHHKNLLGLVGFSFEQGQQMLVYEYMANGSVRDSLSGISGVYLDWKRRLRVALGSARGLTYLHELANPTIIHRDVKTTNILLDEYLTPKVADFGLSKLVSDREKSHVSTQAKGTLGYMDPEYYMTQQLTVKSDVYSYGVVMLELITGRPPLEGSKYVVREVKRLMNKNDEFYGLKEAMDPRIREAPNLFGFGRYVELAMRCVEDSSADRPAMSEVVKEIEAILQTEGVKSSSTSASSSATDFGLKKGSGVKIEHPYKEPLQKKDSDSSCPEFSSDQTTNVEDK